MQYVEHVLMDKADNYCLSVIREINKFYYNHIELFLENANERVTHFLLFISFKIRSRSIFMLLNNTYQKIEYT